MERKDHSLTHSLVTDHSLLLSALRSPPLALGYADVAQSPHCAMLQHLLLPVGPREDAA